MHSCNVIDFQALCTGLRCVGSDEKSLSTLGIIIAVYPICVRLIIFFAESCSQIYTLYYFTV